MDLDLVLIEGPPSMRVVPSTSTVPWKGHSVLPRRPPWHIKVPPPTDECTEYGQMFEIPGHLSKIGSRATEIFVRGFGDTAAKHCFMEDSFASREGLEIDRSDLRPVRLSRNRTVTTTGTAKVSFRFDGEAEVYCITFHLLASCMQDVVLGKSFLKLTKTFSEAKNFGRRVKKRIIKGLSHLRLLYLGDSGPKFIGMLNGRPRQALADWGSNALIMDEDFARKQGLPIIDDPEYQNIVYLADRTKTRTSGMVLGMSWQFGLGGRRREYSLDFHIMKNAPSDIILSDNFLNQTSAFIKYDCCLIDDEEDDDESEAYFFGVKLLSKRGPLTAPEQMAEDRRRDAADDRIAKLPPSKRQEARQQENARQAAWDAQHMFPMETDNSVTQGSLSISASVPSQSSTLNNSLATSSTTSSSGSTPAPSVPIQNSPPTEPVASSPNSRKRWKWRFKLKLKSSITA